jgi:cyanophycinase
MTGVLALVGGGEWREGCTFDARLLERSVAEDVLVVPTGSAYENPSTLVDRATGWFAALGARAVELPVYTRADAMLAEHAERVADARFIYLAGASAMHLRSVLKDSPLFDALEAAWRAGATLAGSAAGADVLCDPMVDSRGGAFTVGLGLVSGLAVIPRANTWSTEKVHRTVQLASPGVAVAAIAERSALVREPDGQWRAEGSGEVALYLDGRAVGLDQLHA